MPIPNSANPAEITPPALSFKRVATRALMLFLPLAMLVGLLQANNMNQQRHLATTLLYAKSQRVLDTYKSAMIGGMATALNDLLFLADSPSIRRYANTHSSADKRAAGELFLALCRNKGIFDQIRLINHQGYEEVRINNFGGHPAIIADESLQDKSGRDYFQAALQLPPGEVYISRFDLNQEFGQVERPFKPVIRLAVPIRDSSGETAAVLVINCLAATILYPPEETLNDNAVQITAIDSNGYWIRGEFPGDEWGFQLPNRKERNFAQLHPEAWSVVDSAVSGDFTTQEGLYSYSTILPASILSKRSGTMASAPDGQNLTLLAFVKDADASRYVQRALHASSIALGTTLSIIAALALAMAVGMERRRGARLILAARNTALQEAMAEVQRAYEEQLEAERRIGTLNARLASVLDAASEVSVIAADAQGTITLFNAGAERMLGYKAAELVGHRSLTVLHVAKELRERIQEIAHGDTDPDDTVSALLHMPATIGHETREWTYVRKNGSRLRVSLSTTSVRDTTGKIEGYLGVARDVTEERVAQRRLAAVLAAAPDAIVTLDGDGMIRTANTTAETMFGFPPGGLDGIFVGGLLPAPYDRMMAPLLYAPQQDAKGMQARELPGRRRDGTVFPLEASVSQVQLEDVPYSVCILRDITRRKEAEDALIRTKNLLERKQAALDTELRSAARMQKNLLPASRPIIPGVSVIWRYEPSMLVGGDIFNVQKLGDGTLAVFMIDVSGHGMSSALVGAAVTQAMRPGAGFLTLPTPDGKISALPPQETLALLDQEFPLERFDNFFTMIHCILDLDTGALNYSGAGHPPPMLLRADGGNIEELDQGGPVIGAGSTSPFPAGSLVLQPGDTLLLYTDGCMEHMDPGGDPFGMSRLAASLYKCRGMTLEDTLESIWYDLKNHGQRQMPEDDLTMLLLRYEGHH